MASRLHHLQQKLQSTWGKLPPLGRSLSLVWAAAPRWTALWGGLLIFQGLLPAATVYLSRILVDSLVTLRGNATWAQIQHTLGWVALMGGLLLLTTLFQELATWVRTAQSELVKDHISTQIHQQSAAVDFSFYESPDYYDRLHRAQVDAQYRPLALLENVGTCLQNSLTLGAMVLVLLPFGVWLPLALLTSTLPAFYVVLRYSLQQHQWWLQTTAEERRAWYYNWLLTAKNNAAELRLFGLGDHFRTAYQQVRQQLREQRLRLLQSQSLAELGASLIALLVTGLTLTWMVWRFIQGQGTLGDLALFYQAFNQSQSVMRSLLQNLGQVYTNSLFLSSLFEFLALDPQVIDPPNPLAVSLEREIRFQQVTFSYPGSERVALKDFDLQIPAGQIVAIVGNNGAGKSTLLKLLCRLYDPQAGHIEMDGIDLRRVSVAQLRRQITVLFQDPVHYNATAADNIALGYLEAQPTREQVVAAAQGSGAEQPILRLPQGYDTLLGRWFSGGTDLSGGEWQRLSLARAFLRQSALVILDEPTSAMDSWAEADWLKRLRSLVAGRTAIIITHRFTTAMCADIIHVMVDGQIVESGDHEQLLAQEGYYAQSWKVQMQGVSQ